MAIKAHEALADRDHVPVSGDHENIEFGIVERITSNGDLRRLDDILVRRLYPIERPASGFPLDAITAERWEILLPPGVDDELRHPAQLCAAYHFGSEPRTGPLAGVMTLRMPGAAQGKQAPKLHDCWELGRGFGRHLSSKLTVAVVVVLHGPACSSGSGAPYVHLVCPNRVLRPLVGFDAFVEPLIDGEEGRAIVDREWREWSAMKAEQDLPGQVQPAARQRGSEWYRAQFRLAATRYARLLKEAEDHPELPSLMSDLQWYAAQCNRSKRRAG